MKFRFNIVAVFILSAFLLFGCGVSDIPLDSDSVTAYFDEHEAPDGVVFLYQDLDGIEALTVLKEGANVTSMGTFITTGNRCKLTGQYDGVWYYGWGSADHLLVGFGDDKETVYGYMQGYESLYSDK